MARDDYHVLVFKVLVYLYKQLKSGEAPDPEMLRHDGSLFQTNEKYWAYILTNMQEKELIGGLEKDEETNRCEHLEDQLQNIQITVKGIEYLLDNGVAERVEKLVKGILRIG